MGRIEAALCGRWNRQNIAVGVGPKAVPQLGWAEDRPWQLIALNNGLLLSIK